MSMTSEEWIDSDDTVTPDQARREIEKHGFAWCSFTATNGEMDDYTGREVLLWLGY